MGRGALLFLMLTASAVGCAPSAPRLDRLRSAPTPVDDATELAALLPDGIDRCVVARPRRIAARRRSLVVYHSWADPWVWDNELPISAYASAMVVGRGGRRARRTYVRFTRDVDEAALHRLPVRWLDRDCEGLACRLPVARFIDPRTVEIQRHPWPPRAERSESSSRCVGGARRYADAFEVAVDTSAESQPVRLPLPRFTDRVLRSHGSRLTFLRISTFRDRRATDEYERWIRERGRIHESSLLMLPPRDRRVSREGTRVSTVDEREWEELELAVEDEALRRRALARDQGRSEPVPVGAVDVTRRTVVQHQVRLRRSALARARGEAHREAAEALADLLARVVEAHPADGTFLTALVRVCLDELHDPARALAALARTESLDGPGPLRREALALVDPEQLAEALLRDGVVDSQDEAALAAVDLAALREAGVSYEWAEAAFQASRALFDGPAPREVSRARLAIEGALAALLVQARLDEGRDDLRVQVAVRASAPGEAQAIGDTAPELLVVRDRGAAGIVMVAAAPSGELSAWRRLGARLAAALPPGPVEIALDLLGSDGVRVRRFRARGRLVGAELELSAVSDTLGGADWAVLSRYVARPLADFPLALFPPPELVVRAETDEVLIGLVSELGAAYPPSCTARGSTLRCRFPQSGTELDELLLDLVRARRALSGSHGL